MQAERPFALSIGGLDPSGGAGILSDVKTFEHMHVNGLAVATCLTGQSHDKVHDISWFDEKEIDMQLDPLFQKYKVDLCKIAVIKNWGQLNMIIDKLLKVDTNMKIVLDPVLRASSGFEFCPIPDADLRNDVLRKIFLVTPNQEEFDLLGLDRNAEYSCNILLKSAQGEDTGTDMLFTEDGSQLVFSPGDFGFEKHGSGCVLSSSIAGQLALGEVLEVAIAMAKRNIEKYLSSSTNLIGTLNT